MNGWREDWTYTTVVAERARERVPEYCVPDEKIVRLVCWEDALRERVRIEDRCAKRANRAALIKHKEYYQGQFRSHSWRSRSVYERGLIDALYAFAL